MPVRPEPVRQRSSYRRLLGNRTLMLLWGGESVSIVGDSFFNLAVLWIVYVRSGSALQTALVGVAWHLSTILFGPFAGVLADRWDRKRIMVGTNLGAAAVVGGLTLVVAGGHLFPALVLAAVFVLNSLTTFLRPARAAVMPAVVGRELLATAEGLFSTVRSVAAFLGNALGGVVVAVVGAAWALVLDAASFAFVAACIAVARLPRRAARPPASGEHSRLPGGFARQLADGWRVIRCHPVTRAMVWLGMLVNVPSFLGSLYPALVDQQLHAGAAAYGAIGAAGVVGGMAGGALAGPLERRVGAGRALAAGWGLGGLSTLGIAASPAVSLTAALQGTLVFGVTAGGVAMGALMVALVPEGYRGRVAGITGSLYVLAIPASTLAAGWLADRVGVAPVIAVGGLWLLAAAGLAWSIPPVRTARIVGDHVNFPGVGES